jgi:Flp pilus assembly protein TadG
MSASRSRSRRRQRGQALVEFAVVFPVMALIIMGVLDLGRAIYTYNTLAQSARVATRTAIVNQTTSVVRTDAIASAPTLGLTDANVDVCFKTESATQTDCSSSTNDCSQADREIGCLAIVRTHVAYTPMTPVISTIFSSVSLSSTSIEPIEYVCPSGSATTC